MNRSDFWKYIWIPITKRIPELDSEEEILIWNPITNKTTVQEAMVANCGARALLDKQPISYDRIFSHWCAIHGPKKSTKDTIEK